MMNTTTTLSRYTQQGSSDLTDWEDTVKDWEDTVKMETTQEVQITQVVSCIVRPEDRPEPMSREARERLIHDHIAVKS